MPEDLIVEHCAPTLAGLKTANMFACRFSDKAHMVREIRAVNEILVPKGIRMIPLRYRSGKALLYLYRPDALERDLACKDALEILRDRGYLAQTANYQIARLRKRICESEEFPHEIGLFLSYPPEDVRGFIREDTCKDAASRCKCVGTWKVYGDAENARACFRRYRSCRETYIRCLEKGMTLQQLAVNHCHS